MSRLGCALTWLGHSAFHIQAEPDGPGIVVDPWLDNPKAPPAARDFAARASIIVVTHAHSDHYSGVAALARRTGATVVAIDEIGADLVADGVPATQVRGGNKGADIIVDGVTFTLTQAMHSSSTTGADGRPRMLGEACGVVIALPNGPVIYDTGDTAVFGDMRLIAEMHRPSLLLLPIGDFYTMGPRQAAKACELVNPEWIVPQHYATFPVLNGTPDALRALLPPSMAARVLAPAPGETLR